jgi:hypothetical protein
MTALDGLDVFAIGYGVKNGGFPYVIYLQAYLHGISFYAVTFIS